jgi:hypothetical protein
MVQWGAAPSQRPAGGVDTAVSRERLFGRGSPGLRRANRLQHRRHASGRLPGEPQSIWNALIDRSGSPIPARMPQTGAWVSCRQTASPPTSPRSRSAGASARPPDRGGQAGPLPAAARGITLQRIGNPRMRPAASAARRWRHCCGGSAIGGQIDAVRPIGPRPPAALPRDLPPRSASGSLAHHGRRDAFDHYVDAGRLAARQRAFDRACHVVGMLHQFAMSA